MKKILFIVQIKTYLCSKNKLQQIVKLVEKFAKF